MKNKKVLFVYTSESLTGISGKSKKIEEGFRQAGCDLDTLYFHSNSNKLARSVDWLFLNIRFLKKISINSPDVIYIRYAYYFFVIYALSLLLGKNIKIEVNSNTQGEFINRGKLRTAKFESFVDKLAVKASSTVHVVSRQLERLYQKRYPSANIVFTPNFVVDEVYQEKSNQEDDGYINIVFLGNTAQPWHGIDLFIEKFVVGQEWFSERCKLHIIGHISNRITELIDTHDISNEVITYGFLSGDEKTKVLRNMDIGIGAFNLGVIGLTETTSIKNGEYLYSGIGLMLGYNDPVIPSTLPFVHSVDMQAKIETEREKIKDFIESYNEIKDVRLNAHQFAKDNLLVEKYIDKIIN